MVDRVHRDMSLVKALGGGSRVYTVRVSKAEMWEEPCAARLLCPRLSATADIRRNTCERRGKRLNPVTAFAVRAYRLHATHPFTPC